MRQSKAIAAFHSTELAAERGAVRVPAIHPRISFRKRRLTCDYIKVLN